MLAALALAGGGATWATDAGAVGTRRFVLNSLDDLSGGDLSGVAVASDGGVRAGWQLGSTALADATAVFCALPMADGSVLVGTSANGKVYRVTTTGPATVYAETGELAVASLVETPWGVLAGTLPGGKIWKLAQGKATVFATLPGAEHVWALAYDKAMASLFAATGPSGKLFRVAANGAPSVYYDSDQPNLVSLAIEERTGDVFVGSSGKALVYHLSGPGRASVFHDFASTEVKALAFDKAGVLWAIANEYADPPEPPKRPANATRAPAGPSTSPRPKPGKGALHRFDREGRPERVMSHGEFHYTSLALDDQGTPYVGTGAEGRVYSASDSHIVTLMADTAERSIGAVGFLRDKGRTPFVAASDPAVFHGLIARGGADATWTSKALDAGLRARFGALSWQASGPLSFSVRSGNSATPDGTWSPWSNDMSAPGPIPSPPARYVQVRARWNRDPQAVLRDVVVPFSTDNLRAVVTDVSGQQKGVTRDARQGLIASGSEPPKHDNVVKLTWKVDNPDGDALRYRISIRREGQPLWRDLTRDSDVHTKTDYDWDTSAIEEGRYRVRVEASDELANPPAEVRKHALESAIVLVDNTPPVFRNVTLAGRRLQGEVVDGLGPIARIDVAVNGRTEFRPIAPADGIFDGAAERFDADLALLVPPGPQTVTVRAFDLAGNSVTKELVAK
jgi:hypothetical protein